MKKLYICSKCQKRWDYPWTDEQLGISNPEFSKEIYFHRLRDWFLKFKKYHEIFQKYPNLGDMNPDDFQNDLDYNHDKTCLLRHHKNYVYTGGRMDYFDCGPIELVEIDDYQDQLEHFLGIQF